MCWRSVAALLLVLAVVAMPAAAEGVYRWVDGQGRTHFGDQPVNGAEALDIPAFAPQRLRYTVVKVPDGDTVYLSNGDRVRLLGINAPEIAHRNRPGEPGGEQAAVFLRDLLLGQASGQRVGLVDDVERQDSYQRRLAHLFDDQGNNLNQLMVEQGLAFVYLHPPNLKFSDDYLAAEQRARAEQRGLWALDRYQIQSMRKAGEWRNSFRRLRGTLKSVQHKRKYSYLKFSSGLTASIPSQYLQSFRDAGKDPDAMLGRQLVIRGWVKRYRGKPSMFLNHPSHIESVQ
jgi:micrococcal nuclease